jgi:microcystin-dependent protein
MEVFIGTIQSFAFNFAPRDWALCNGQTLSLAQYQTLFALIGITYGGNGQTNFMLPNLQSRLQIGQGNGANLTPRVIGTSDGSENVSLTINNLPNHTHTIDSSGLRVATTIGLAAEASSPTTAPSATNAYLGASGGGPGSANIYSNQQGNGPVPLQGVSNALSGAITAAPAGNGAPASLMNPFLAVNFSIALSGLFPSRN